MDEFFVVMMIAIVAASLTLGGAFFGELRSFPSGVVNGALQFAAGIKIAVVTISLMPQAVRAISPLMAVVTFCSGGVLFILLEFVLERSLKASPSLDPSTTPLGVYIAVLGDMVIDGAVIGLVAGLSLAAGLTLAISLGIEMGTLAFVTTAAATKRRKPEEKPSPIKFAFFAIVLLSALMGYLLLRNQPETLKFALVALASGFLLAGVTQGLIPGAINKDNPSLAGLMFIAGLASYAVLSIRS